MATPPQRPLRERMRAVQELAAAHGGIEQIPEDDLGQLDYVKFYDRDGVVKVLPIEKVAEDSLKRRIKDSEPISTEPPFEELSFTVETRTGYGTTMPADIVQEQLDDRLALFEDDKGTYTYDVRVKWLPNDDPVNQVLAGMKGYFTAGSAENSNTTYPITLPGTPYEALSSLTEKMQRGSEEIFRILRSSPSDNIDMEAAENIWQLLEKLKSQVTDPVELEKLFEEKLPQMRVLSSEAYAGSEVAEYYSDFNKYIRIYAQYLASNGFESTALLLKDTQSLTDARAVVDDAIRVNEISTQYKIDDNALKDKHALLTEQADIRQNGIDRSQLKKEFKQKMQVLRGVQGLLNTPTLFADVFTRKINELQKNFISTKAASSIPISLDGTYDPEKDSNPGRISGDCTEDKPLPFDQNVGLHNIKVNVAGEHKGNIYLLQTTGSDSTTKVWHLDAIQIASGTIDWDSFVPNFITKLSSAAEENDISMITINLSSYHISNYAYISKAFLQHTGRQFSGFDVDNETRLYDASPNGTHAPLTAIHFPQYAMSENVSKFQGEDDTQIVLWQAETST